MTPFDIKNNGLVWFNMIGSETSLHLYNRDPLNRRLKIHLPAVLILRPLDPEGADDSRGPGEVKDQEVDGEMTQKNQP